MRATVVENKRPQLLRLLRLLLLQGRMRSDFGMVVEEELLIAVVVADMELVMVMF